MKWFYKLKNKYRVLIAIGSWLPMFIMGVLLGDQTDNFTTIQSLLSVLFLAVGLFFTIFAVKAYNTQNPQKEKQLSTKNTTVITYNQTQPTQELTYFDNIIKVYEFDIFLKNLDNVNFKVGEPLIIKHLPSVISNTTDAVVFYNNVKLGYLSHIEARILRDLYGKQDYTCVIDSFNENEMLVKIKLPYKKDNLLIPSVINLVGVTFENRQEHIKNCHRKDLVIVKHEPTTEYPNKIIVYHLNSNLSIGVIPEKDANKILKKYGNNCLFYGCIKSIYGEPSKGVDIYLLTQNEYPNTQTN